MQAALRRFGAGGAAAALACALMMTAISLPARADDDDEGPAKPRSYPYLKGEVSLEFEHDNVFDADDPDAEGSDTYNTTTISVGAYFSERFSLHGTFIFEPVLDPEPGEDRVFEDHGLYAEELYAKLTFDPFELYAGKFNPAFGRAWDDTPGVYGTALAEDYELTERIGAGFSVEKDKTPLGKLTFKGAAFTADTSGLSNSAFTNRGQTQREDGGLSNTGDLDSFALSIESEEIPGFAGLSFNIGYVHQAAGIDDLDDQNGFVLGLQLERTYNNVKVEWIGETAYFDYGGNLYDEDDDGLFVETLWYYTLGAQASINDKYRVSASYTARYADLFDGAEFDDYQYQVSAGMKLGRDWWLDAGYKFLQEQDEESHTVGLLLTKTIEFDTGELEPASSLK
jgi:hypothetical protein